MSLSNSWIEIIILYSIIFIICVICCIKFCSWCKSDNDIDNVEIPNLFYHYVVYHYQQYTKLSN